MPYVRDKGVLRSVDFNIVPEGRDEADMVLVGAGATVDGTRNEVDCRISRDKHTSITIYQECSRRQATGAAAALLRRTIKAPTESEMRCERRCKRVCCACCCDCTGGHLRFHEETLTVGSHVRVVGVLHIDEAGRRSVRAIPKERPLTMGWTCFWGMPIMPIVYWGLLVGAHHETSAGAEAVADTVVDMAPPATGEQTSAAAASAAAAAAASGKDQSHPPAAAGVSSAAVVMGLPMPSVASDMRYAAVPPADASGWPASVAYPLLGPGQPEAQAATAAAAAAPPAAAAPAAAAAAIVEADLAVPVVPFEYHVDAAMARHEEAWAATGDRRPGGRIAPAAADRAGAADEPAEALPADPVPAAAASGGWAAERAVAGAAVPDLDRWAAKVHEQTPHVNDRCTARLKAVIISVVVVGLVIVVGGQLALIFGVSAPCPTGGEVAGNSTAASGSGSDDADLPTACKEGQDTYIKDTGVFIAALLGYIFGVCALVAWLIIGSTKGVSAKTKKLKELIPDVNSPTARAGDVVRVVGIVRPAPGAPLLGAPLSSKRVVLHHSFTDHWESDD